MRPPTRKHILPKAFVLLFITFYLFSIATIQGMANYLSSDEGQAADEELRRQIVTYFGSVFKAMMSYHMATSGGKEWALYYEVLVQASEMTAALFALVVAFTQIALLNIMTGIFVETAMKLAELGCAYLSGFGLFCLVVKRIAEARERFKSGRDLSFDSPFDNPIRSLE